MEHVLPDPVLIDASEQPIEAASAILRSGAVGAARTVKAIAEGDHTYGRLELDASKYILDRVLGKEGSGDTWASLLEHFMEDVK